MPTVGDNDEHHAWAQLSAPNNFLRAVFLCCKLFFFFFPLPLISFSVCREGETDGQNKGRIQFPDFADRQEKGLKKVVKRVRKTLKYPQLGEQPPSHDTNQEPRQGCSGILPPSCKTPGRINCYFNWLPFPGPAALEGSHPGETSALLHPR